MTVPWHWDVQERARAELITLDAGIALRAAGMRDDVHPFDVHPSLYRDPNLAEWVARANRHIYDHVVYGPFVVEGGYLHIVDLRPALTRLGRQPLDPTWPDWRRV